MVRRVSAAVADMADAIVVPVSGRTDGPHKWHPISVACDSVIIRGGYNTSREPANSLTMDDGLGLVDSVRTFVELDKNARWFLKGVGGSKITKGDLKAVEVMSMIRATLKHREAASRHRGAAAAIAEQIVDEFVDPTTVVTDPMDALDALDDMDQPAQPKAHKYRKLTSHDRRALVEQLSVPTRPSCTGRGGDGTTTITIYRLPMADRRSNGHLYLRTDCIGWLLAYAADELHYQGVVAPCPVPQSRPANCAAVAGLRMEWAFATQEWACEFVDGPLLGTKHRFAVRDLTKDQFDDMRANNKLDAYWSNATLVDKKGVAKDIAMSWGHSTAARGGAPECGGPPELQVAAVAVGDGCLAVVGA
jgi:hypothetical protein